MAGLEDVNDILEKSKKPVPFTKIGEKVKKLNHYPDDRVGNLYADMTFDPRFCNLKNNTWDLTSRHTYDEIHAGANFDIDDEYSSVNIEENDYENEDENSSDNYREKTVSEALEDYDVSEENSRYEDED